MLAVAVPIAQGTSGGADPWLVVGVALIAATAALVGAVIAARTASTRQKEQLAHDGRRQDKALAASAESQKTALAAERERLDDRLEHERALADVADLRHVAEAVMSSENAIWFSSLELFGKAPREEVLLRIQKATQELQHALDALYVRLPQDSPLVVAARQLLKTSMPPAMLR